MADHNDLVLRIEFLMRSRRHVAHGHELGAHNLRSFELPGFADIKQRKRLTLVKLASTSSGVIS